MKNQLCASSPFIQDDDKKLWKKSIKADLRDVVTTIKTGYVGGGLAERKNAGKLQYSLLDLKMLAPCVSVLEFGAVKYARGGYKKGFPETQIIDSMVRHIAALLSGEVLDPESGLPHIGHIQCNALFLGCEKNVKDLTEVANDL